MLPEFKSDAAILLLHSHGCPHCVEFRPRLAAMRRNMPGVEVWEIDVGRDPMGAEVARHLAVSALPTTIFVSRRVPVGRSEGSLANDEFLRRAATAFWDQPGAVKP